jgi:membrane fusion protein (multidrug efflux system)
MSTDELSRLEEGRRAPREAVTPPEPTSTRGQKPRQRRALRLALVAIAALALLIGGTLWWLDARHYESTDDAFIDVHVVKIAPQVAGRVARVLVGDNQPVAAGAPVIELDPVDFQAKLDQALANQGSARAALAQARAQQVVTEANAQEAQAQVTVAQANAINAANQLDRDRPLAEQHVVSRQTLDNDIANARSTAATLVSAQKIDAGGRDIGR